MKIQKEETVHLPPKQQIRWLVVVLVTLTMVLISGRLLFFGKETLAGGDRLWRLTVDISSEETTTQAPFLKISTPFNTPNIRVIQRIINHPGFRISNRSEDSLSRNNILAFASARGRQSLTAEFIIHVSTVPGTSLTDGTVELTTEQREKFLLNQDSLNLGHPSIQKTLMQLRQKNPDQEALIDAIFTMLKNFAPGRGNHVLNVPSTLASKKATTLDRALAMVALCRAAGIPARVVAGLILKEDINLQPYYWVETFQQDRWLSYDPGFGYKKTVPVNYLPMRKNGHEIVQIQNGKLVQTEFFLEPEYDHPYLRQMKSAPAVAMFDLTRLPLEARDDLALLLLLPLGALITALFRHLIGVHSYGVFTPTLLALSIVYTNIVTTSVIFLVVCSLAFGGRNVFPSTITRIPRLSIIFTLVAIILSMSVSVMFYFDLYEGGKVILLPVIILTTLIDRLYRTIDESGIQTGMRRLIWTMIITLLCLPIIQFETLGHLIVQYPEIHLTTLAVFLLISTYKGKQLVHLPIVKLLAEPEKPKRKRKSKPDKPVSEDTPHAS